MLIIQGRLKFPSGLAFLFLLMLSLVSCNFGLLLESKNTGEGSDGKGTIPDYTGRQAGTFYALNTATNARYTVNAVHLAENSSCIVYGERSAGVSIETAEAIATGFETGVYPVIKEIFGDFQEYLGNKGFGRYDKLTLLLLDIKDGYNGMANSSYVAGYFYPGDMHNKTMFSRSNERAILYLDVNPGKPGDSSFFSTIAHEFQHLINFSIRMEQQGGGLNVKSQDTWIDEGLASAAEYLYAREHIKSKIDYFNDDYENYFSRGDTFLTWDSQYEDYCTIYLFFQWLRIQAGGSQIYQDIINSEHLDYRAVTEAAAEHIDGRFGDWETLLSHWLLANHVNASTGSLGYKGEITTTIRAITGKSVSLAPGEGVFSYLDGTGFSPANVSAGSHIRYFGVTQDGEFIEAAGGVFPSGKIGRILTFNANTESKTRGSQTDSTWNKEVNSVSETGYLTGKAESRTSGGKRQAVPAGPYPVDIPPAFFLE